VRAVFASGNPNKALELGEALPGWEIEPLGARLPDETGSTFYENARAKADFGRAAAPPGVWILAEDSGLEVEALAGAPGIRSARYAGPTASDAENVSMLLAALDGVALERRRARFVAELVCLSPDGSEFRGRGSLEGAIAPEPRGSAGFGYDPVFIPAGETRTVAELGDGWKREHSHRARAARALLASLGTWAESL
jgi:XTP/dITP diphosphohydrolase